ncbi:hypothetical protein AZF00_02590 [Zhongshania aliphaticivorans]|uniref:Uncharacterized protein n=1 Tax=Zhongshania aliphaticivorans TaxID=1470434 RepID=A0A127M1Y8_9GAMM|nr:hypothetical protein AZF00_02590 [Zhongshania aliphaticivorans]
MFVECLGNVAGKSGENVKTKKSHARYVVRVNEDIHMLIRSAAELSGSSMSQLLIDAAVSRARKVIGQKTSIKLTLQGAEKMHAALENSPVTSDALLDAAKNYKDKNYSETHFSDDPEGQ